MLIEIKDREFYIKKCKLTIAKIEAARASRDRRYEEWWRRQWPARYWRKETDMPPKKYPFYPTIHAWEQLGVVRQILQALLSDRTGTIEITGEELDYLDS